MALMAVCGVLVLAGLTAIVRWGGLEPQLPWQAAEPDDPPSGGTVGRRYLWYATVAVTSGLVAGVLVAGAGGRLAMRLLAATAGDGAQGRITEAEEVVGEITLGGTVGFIVFMALVFGVVTGGLFLLIRRWLPGGRLCGLVFGIVLLVVGASRVEPLRQNNPDFDIVGPGWVSVVVFAVLVVAHGMAVAAIAGRYSRSLPLVARRRPALVAYAPLLFLLPVGALLLPIAVVGVLVVLAGRSRGVLAALRSSRFEVVGRAVLAAVVLVAVPGFVSTVADIVDRGP